MAIIGVCGSPIQGGNTYRMVQFYKHIPKLGSLRSLRDVVSLKPVFRSPEFGKTQLKVLNGLVVDC